MPHVDLKRKPTPLMWPLLPRRQSKASLEPAALKVAAAAAATTAVSGFRADAGADARTDASSVSLAGAAAWKGVWRAWAADGAAARRKTYRHVNGPTSPGQAQLPEVPPCLPPPPESAPLTRGTSLDSDLADAVPPPKLGTGDEGSPLGTSLDGGQETAGEQQTPRGVAELAARVRQLQAIKAKGVDDEEKGAGEGPSGGDVQAAMPGAPPAGFLKPPVASQAAKGLPPKSEWPHFPILVPRPSPLWTPCYPHP
jgi:hypothetical protein